MPLFNIYTAESNLSTVYSIHNIVFSIIEFIINTRCGDQVQIVAITI